MHLGSIWPVCSKFSGLSKFRDIIINIHAMFTSIYRPIYLDPSYAPGHHPACAFEVLWLEQGTQGELRVEDCRHGSSLILDRFNRRLRGYLRSREGSG